MRRPYGNMAKNKHNAKKEQQTPAEYGKKGGRTTLKRYGSAHFAKLAKLSHKKRKQRAGA